MYRPQQIQNENFLTSESICSSSTSQICCCTTSCSSRTFSLSSSVMLRRSLEPGMIDQRDEWIHHMQWSYVWLVHLSRSRAAKAADFRCFARSNLSKRCCRTGEYSPKPITVPFSFMHITIDCGTILLLLIYETLFVLSMYVFVSTGVSDWRKVKLGVA